MGIQRLTWIYRGYTGEYIKNAQDISLGHTWNIYRITKSYTRRDLSTSMRNENNMAAGGNVEVVWSNLINYLIPESPQVQGIYIYISY